MKAIVCVGISASGKSTFAEALFTKSGYAEVNRDNVRFNHFCNGRRDWRLYKFTKANEKYVTEVCDRDIDTWASLGINIVCSDTNLNPKYRKALISKLEDLGYEVEIKEFPITLEEAWKRDDNRVGGVGRSVIYSQYLKWLEYKGERKYTPDTTLQKTILCDVDGTVASMQGVRKPYEWDKVHLDKPRHFVISMVEGIAIEEDYHVIFLSGRDGCCFQETKDWLNTNVGCNFELMMRSAGDNRKDAEVKYEIFWNDIADNYNVVGVFDDRPCMIRKWYEIGIENVISVANPWVEF